MGLLWQLDEGHGQLGSAPRSVAWVVHVIALVTQYWVSGGCVWL